MSTERVEIESDFPLEGILNLISTEKAVIVCHPHPLYGGSMDNNVVLALEDGFLRAGYSTLRFNFRGVGRSKGYYSDGVGEVRDLISAYRFLKSQLDIGSRLILAGYSFGAWVSVMAEKELIVSGFLLVSYPFSFYPSSSVENLRKAVCLICGRYDSISPVSENLRVYEALPQIEKTLKVIDTDHFYLGKEKELADFIERIF